LNRIKTIGNKEKSTWITFITTLGFDAMIGSIVSERTKEEERRGGGKRTERWLVVRLKG